MQPEQFSPGKSGRLLKHPDGFWAFIPNPLPPQLSPDENLTDRIASAERELARLSDAAQNLPNPDLLLSLFVRREAVLSSRIEGTRASLSDLFLFEAGGPPAEDSDVQEVANYVDALEYGLRRLETLPISMRLLNELHERLMTGVGGDHLTPGEFRRSPNWIGPPGSTLTDATYVPPPVPDMKDALADLEKFIHAPATLPPLVRLALVHYQFQAIHPYLDGNGPIGRLLITLMLRAQNILRHPLLCLSAFFEKHRGDYYRLLLAVSRRGEWGPWIDFFLEGVAEQSADAIRRVEQLLALRESYVQKLHAGNASASPLRLVDELFRHPVITVAQAAHRLAVTPRTAALTIKKLVSLGILSEVTGRDRHRMLAAREIIRIAEADDPDAPDLYPQITSRPASHASGRPS